MNAITITSQKINEQEFSQCKLSIEVSLNGICYCVINTSNNTFIALEYIPFSDAGSTEELITKLYSSYKHHELLNKNYKETLILYKASKSTLIPAELYREADKMLFFKFNHRQSESETVLNQPLNNLKAQLLYAIPTKLMNELELIFKKPTLRSHAGSLIENLLFQNKDKDVRVYLHVQNKTFDIAVLRNKDLILYNHYQYTQPEELVYFVVFTMNQLKLNTQKTPVVFLGELSKQSEEIALLAKYIQNITYGARNETFRYNTAIEELPRHYFYNLLNFHV